jgi:hypothetical protein
VVKSSFNFFSNPQKSFSKAHSLQYKKGYEDQLSLKSRVARWIIFKPKIPIWLYFGGP